MNYIRKKIHQESVSIDEQISSLNIEEFMVWTGFDLDKFSTFKRNKGPRSGEYLTLIFTSEDYDSKFIYKAWKKQSQNEELVRVFIYGPKEEEKIIDNLFHNGTSEYLDDIF
jgi:hypothetical protein